MDALAAHGLPRAVGHLLLAEDLPQEVGEAVDEDLVVRFEDAGEDVPLGTAGLFDGV